jgi:hypothetical protein
MARVLGARFHEYTRGSVEVTRAHAGRAWSYDDWTGAMCTGTSAPIVEQRARRPPPRNESSPAIGREAASSPLRNDELRRERECARRARSERFTSRNPRQKIGPVP